MELKQESLDQFLELTAAPETEAQKNAKKIVENDGLIERTTLIEKKLIIEDGRQLLVEERPITHSDILS
jgi:hypothetical protein